MWRRVRVASGAARPARRSASAVVCFASDGPTTGAATARFSITAAVKFGEHVRVVGGAPALGDWSPADALQLTWSEGDRWEGAAELPAGERIEFKFLICPAGGSPAWEPGDNRSAVLPADASADIFAGRWGDAASTEVTLGSAPAPAAPAAHPEPAAAAAPAAAAEPAPAAPAAVAGPSEAEVALRAELEALKSEVGKWRGEAAALAARLQAARGGLAEGLAALAAGQQQLAEAVRAALAAGAEPPAPQARERAAALQAQLAAVGAKLDDTAAALGEKEARPAKGASLADAAAAPAAALVAALEAAANAPPPAKPAADAPAARAPRAASRRTSSSSAAAAGAGAGAGASAGEEEGGKASRGSRSSSRRTSMSLDPEMALDDYLSSGNIQSYFKGMAYATIRLLGAWEPGMERTLGGFSACWRDFKERWGSEDIGQARRALTTADTLVSAAAVDPIMAAQMVWTVAYLADGSPQLTAALARGGVDLGAEPAIAKLRDGSGGLAEERWCSDLLSTARTRGRR